MLYLTCQELTNCALYVEILWIKCLEILEHHKEVIFINFLALD